MHPPVVNDHMLSPAHSVVKQEFLLDNDESMINTQNQITMQPPSTKHLQSKREVADADMDSAG